MYSDKGIIKPYKNIDEVSALIDKKSLLDMYRLATEAAYSFLYVKLTSRIKNEIFMIRHQKCMTIEDN